MAPRRPRFQPQDLETCPLYDVLFQYLTVPTKIEYGEDATSGVEPKLIKQHAKLMSRLRSLQENLSFSQARMKGALVKVAHKKTVEGDRVGGKGLLAQGQQAHSFYVCALGSCSSQATSPTLGTRHHVSRCGGDARRCAFSLQWCWLGNRDRGRLNR